MALHHGAKEVVWLRRLLEEIGVCQKEPTVIFCDNESAVKLAKNACLHRLTKHIRPKWHWVRRLLDKEVRLEIVKAHQQAADILTKRLAESEHWKGMKLAGMTPCLGPERERYFLVVVDDYSCYTIVFPLAKKSEVTSTLIWWLLAIEGTRSSRVRCLHFDRGERRIGLVMEIARTSMIHACAPHFLWPYAVRYAAHQLNICPRVSRPGDSPTSLWTGSPSVALEFHVWGCLALVRNTSADKLSARAIPCVFLGFAVNSPDIAFYHPLLHRFLGSRDIRFDESVSYYVRSPCRGLPPPPPHLFIAPFPPPSPTPLVPLPPLVLPHQVPLSSLRHFRDRLLGGVGARGAGAGGAGTGGASSRGARAGGAGSEGAISGGAGAGGASTGGVITEETGAGCTNSTMPMPPPHHYDMRLQALRHLEREEQKKLEQERQELQKLDQQE
ncbi:unnamed protein product [Closterium sp. NIES-53]